ncbi:MAG: hypothetical protein ACOX9R_01435 [Armatimonadota bacterium]|jgi:hypothetical protein
MSRRLNARSFTPWAIALLLWIVARIAYVAWVERDGDVRPIGEATVIVKETSETTLRPLPVEPPQQERWRDIAGVAYGESFRERFDYARTHAHSAEVRYEPRAHTLQGTVIARHLKPSFAYQLKLVGLVPITGVTEAENAGDARTWSSWQLGRVGRWWCDDCEWNLLDRELAGHLDDGHSVTGYLLFDWFVTDELGDASRPFALDSSLHVLWRVDQRERGRHDSPPRWYTVKRLPEFYPEEAAGTSQEVALFAEWEPDRPRIGDARPAYGRYHVGLNLTEESFHDNMDGPRMLESGGFWARVLQSDLQFEVVPSEGGAVDQ